MIDLVEVKRRSWRVFGRYAPLGITHDLESGTDSPLSECCDAKRNTHQAAKMWPQKGRDRDERRHNPKAHRSRAACGDS